MRDLLAGDYTVADIRDLEARGSLTKHEADTAIDYINRPQSESTKFPKLPKGFKHSDAEPFAIVQPLRLRPEVREMMAKLSGIIR